MSCASGDSEHKNIARKTVHVHKDQTKLGLDRRETPCVHTSHPRKYTSDRGIEKLATPLSRGAFLGEKDMRPSVHDRMRLTCDAIGERRLCCTCLCRRTPRGWEAGVANISKYSLVKRRDYNVRLIWQLETNLTPMNKYSDLL